MSLNEILQDIHRLNHELERFERKYGVMSETFYKAYRAGEEPEDDAWVLDFAKWAGLYEVWRDRQMVYAQTMRQLVQEEPSLSKIIRTVAV